MLSDSSQVNGFIDYNRLDKSVNPNISYLFQSHPSYHLDNGQLDSIWMDWALFDLDEMNILCQILCFLNLKGLKQPHASIEDYLTAKEGVYCVVCRFVQTSTDKPSHFVRREKLKSKLFLYEADNIVSPID